jgi:predicted Rossmann-fold nucleotide-binding protein
LTLIQTGKIQPIPVLLYGRAFWERVVNFDALVEEGVISAKDLSIFTYCETAEEGWAHVQEFYRNRGDAEGEAEAEANAAAEIAAQADKAG